MTVGFKAFFYSIYLFSSLEGLHRFNVAIILCLLKIFLGPQAQKLLISETRKGEGRNIEDEIDSPLLLFSRSEILFCLLFSPFSGNLQRVAAPPTPAPRRIRPCLIPVLLYLPTSSAVCCSQDAFYFFPPSRYPGWINMSPFVTLCITVPMKWKRHLEVVVVICFLESTSVYIGWCMIYWWWWRNIPKGRVLLLTSGPLSFITCHALV